MVLYTNTKRILGEKLKKDTKAYKVTKKIRYNLYAITLIQEND